MTAQPTVHGVMPRSPGKPSLPLDQAERIRDGVEYLLFVHFENNKTALAKKLGTSQPAVSQWLSRTNRPSLATAIEVAQLLGMTETDLRLRGLDDARREELAELRSKQNGDALDPALTEAAATLGAKSGRSGAEVLELLGFATGPITHDRQRIGTRVLEVAETLKKERAHGAKKRSAKKVAAGERAIAHEHAELAKKTPRRRRA